MARKYKLISYEDRKTIEKLYKKGVSCQKIANQIGVHKVTVLREKKRGWNEKTNSYDAEKGQRALLR